MTEEMSEFISKFNRLLSDGKKAKLVMECQDRQVRVLLETFLDPAAAGNAGHQDHPHEARAGPARLRRRARRAEARHPGGGHAGHPYQQTRRAAQHPLPACSVHHAAAARANYPHKYPAGRAEPHPSHHPPHPDHPGPPLPAPVLAQHTAGCSTPKLSVPPYSDHPHPRRKGSRQLQREWMRKTPVHRRLGLDLAATAVVHPQQDCCPPPPQVVGQATHTAAEDPLHRAGVPDDDTPPDDPAPPPLQLLPNCTTPSYSAVAKTSTKTLARPPDHPSSPAGWGALDPTRALVESDSDDEEPVRVQNGADLSSFCFSLSKSSQVPPPTSQGYSQPSSSRILRPRISRNSLSDLRKPVSYLKGLLSQNIERAIMNRRGGRGAWVWDVAVRRDFEENMVWDNTNFHGFSYSEDYEDYKSATDEHFNAARY